MPLYTISDLHLPLGVNKPMDIFGAAWAGYVDKLRDNWQNTVGEDDIVVLPGDFSWATYLEDAKRDFEFLESLKGKKVLLKGNHDYWWETMNKMKIYAEDNGYKSVDFLQNNSFEYNNIAICGTRGWILPDNKSFGGEDRKIYEREAARLELSLKSADEQAEKYVFMHYPPISTECKQNEFTELFKKYDVKKCIYGHLHAKSYEKALQGTVDGREYLLVSCDYVKFMPVKLSD